VGAGFEPQAIIDPPTMQVEDELLPLYILAADPSAHQQFALNWLRELRASLDDAMSHSDMLKDE